MDVHAARLRMHSTLFCLEQAFSKAYFFFIFFLSDHTCSNAFLCDYSLLPTVYLPWLRLVHGVIVAAIVLLGSTTALVLPVALIG